MQPFGAIPPPARWLLVAMAVIWLAAELRQSTHRRPEGVTAAKGSAMYVRGFTALRSRRAPTSR